MSKPSQSDIAKRAYHLWERDGRPHGRDQEHWHNAEREILGAATAQEDRPIGEVRSAMQASDRPLSTRQASEKPMSEKQISESAGGAKQMRDQQTTDRQSGSVAPGRPGHPASPAPTQAAAATSKRAPQAQGEQRAGAKPQQSASDTTSSRKPRPKPSKP